MERLLLKLKGVRSWDDVDKGVISLELTEFRDLLKSCGDERVNADDSVVYFDDIANIAKHFHDTSKDDVLLEAFQRKGLLLKRELKALILRCFVFVALAIFILTFFLITMVVDVYLIAQSMYGGTFLSSKRITIIHHAF